MKMFKTIPIFILLFTGYCVKNVCVAAAESETESPSTLLPESSLITIIDDYRDSGSETDTYSTAPVSQAALLVAGLSIAFVLFLICVVIGIWNARKFSKEKRRNESSIAW